MFDLCQFFAIYVFFFKQKTAYEMRISDWSSDVCSSDLSGNADSPSADSLPESPDSRCSGPQGVPDSRQPARTPQQKGERLGWRPQRANRTVLLAGLRPGVEIGRAHV